MTDLPEYLYRFGSRVKDLALIRQTDWLTGLSFYDTPFGKEYSTLMVKTLIANGFVVKRDGGELVRVLWSGEIFIEPNSGESLHFPENHVSVWHPDRAFWDAWYEADTKTKNTPEISKQLAYFALARVQS
jgi:hypothetical protein